MYVKTFRYKVRRTLIDEVLDVNREMFERYKAYTQLKKAILIRNVDEDLLEVLEMYVFESWNKWKELMEKTKDDKELEDLWNKFISLVSEDEIIEEDWEILEENLSE
ncbi:MAG: hypothetical protein DRJ35_07665 [Thermoprotei archaeon]|nr:MAG: hypothetical protein DRJ35_07665 [Thermoprotei archaeon]